ncbi:MAG: hypothetical protein AB1724_07575 [Thermodesulfobacteriota bacterium]
MNKSLLLLLILASIAGCAGLDITPISPTDEIAAHSGDKKLKGYVVYEPMVVVEVSQKEVCGEKDDKGNCKGATYITCAAGAPFLLPDTSKPFLVNVRSGFGKTGVDVAITNGWQIGNIKDESDNTALLGTVEKLLDAAIKKGISPDPISGKCKAPGLYHVVSTSTGIALQPLLIY